MTATRRRSYAWLVASLLVSLTAAVPLAFVTFPHVHRWRLLSGLDSNDLDTRERALQYVLARSPHDELVLRGAVARLTRLDDEPFFQLAKTLDMAGLWRRPAIPDEAWLRWLAPLIDDVTVEGRALAAQRLADLNDLATDPRIVQHVARLLADEQGEVRLNALAAAAELAGAARYRGLDPRPLDDLVLQATRDAEPRIAHDAYIFVGLLDPASGVSANWQDAPPSVARAIRWAATRTHPDQPLQWTTLPPPIDAPDVLRPWLNLPDAPRVAVAGHQAMMAIDALRVVESVEQGRVEIIITPEMPDMLRLAAVAATKTPSLDDLRPLFAHDEPSMRDLACIVAVKRFSPEQHEALAGALLRSFDDRDKMSGAMLCGLTGVRPRASIIDLATTLELREVDLLAYRLQHEDIWEVQQVLRLAVWMQGDEVRDSKDRTLEPRQLTAALLSMPDNVPLTTVLLAMLHMRDPAALEYLLNPRGEQRVDLVQLLDQQRWWRVLRHYLPDDAPGYIWWTDADADRFQVEVLRNWYLVHRVRIRDEWNSTPPASGSRSYGETGQQ
jgi:hypothetical protein